MDGKRSVPGRQEPRQNSRLVGIHSIRGGSGRTTVAANLAYLAARSGSRVALLDADLQAPALHHVLGVDAKRILISVSDFVMGRCELSEVPIDLSKELAVDAPGSLHFLPARTDLRTVASILFDGYDVARLDRDLLRLAEELDLDYLILDTHLGFNRETLLSIALADTVLILLRPDGQDSSGSAVLVHLARRLGVPCCAVVPNMVAKGVDLAGLARDVEKSVGAPVAGVLPWCGELLAAGRRRLFTAEHPEHPLSLELERICERLLPARATFAGGAA